MLVMKRSWLRRAAAGVGIPVKYWRGRGPFEKRRIVEHFLKQFGSLYDFTFRGNSSECPREAGGRASPWARPQRSTGPTQSAERVSDAATPAPGLRERTGRQGEVLPVAGPRGEGFALL